MKYFKFSHKENWAQCLTLTRETHRPLLVVTVIFWEQSLPQQLGWIKFYLILSHSMFRDANNSSKVISDYSSNKRINIKWLFILWQQVNLKDNILIKINNNYIPLHDNEIMPLRQSWNDVFSVIMTLKCFSSSQLPLKFPGWNEKN